MIYMDRLVSRIKEIMRSMTSEKLEFKMDGRVYDGLPTGYFGILKIKEKGMVGG